MNFKVIQIDKERRPEGDTVVHGMSSAGVTVVVRFRHGELASRANVKKRFESEYSRYVENRPKEVRVGDVI